MTQPAAESQPQPRPQLGAPRYERLSARPRCRDCRRPDGAEIIAWRDGWYAIIAPPNGPWAVYRPDGRPELNPVIATARLESLGWKPVTVTLDADGRCPRCAYIARHNLNHSRR